jgi:antitoxin (DNA-binding transcriptional repressor) of toxin-antitoxin stability system
MRTVSIRQLHERTGQVVRSAAAAGEIQVTDRGKTVAKIVPDSGLATTPYFARRKLRPEFRRLTASGKFRGGKDSTDMISEERDHAVK